MLPVRFHPIFESFLRLLQLLLFFLLLLPCLSPHNIIPCLYVLIATKYVELSLQEFIHLDFNPFALLLLLHLEDLLHFPRLYLLGLKGHLWKQSHL